MALYIHVYSKDKSFDSKMYWRCEDRTCKGRLVMQSNNPVKMTSHTTHGPNKFEAEVQKPMGRLKEAASSSQEPLVA